MEAAAIITGVVLVLSILGWMAWMAHRVDPPAASPPIVQQGIPAITREKVDKNIRRYKLAIEQNQKGKARDTELRRELDYWKTLDIALRAKGE